MTNTSDTPAAPPAAIPIACAANQRYIKGPQGDRWRPNLDMKPTLKLRFLDCSLGYVPEEQRIYQMLARKYDIDNASEPDYVISCGLGYEHLRYPKSIKILWAGENIVPNFNWFDYAIGFDHLTFDDRYVRVPLYFFYQDDMRRVFNRTTHDDDFYLNRGFCSFVVSNGGGGSNAH